MYVFLHIIHAFFIFNDSGKKLSLLFDFFPLFYRSKGEGVFDINKYFLERWKLFMNEKVFMDQYQKSFLDEEEFITFLQKREENSA